MCTKLLHNQGFVGLCNSAIDQMGNNKYYPVVLKPLHIKAPHIDMQYWPHTPILKDLWPGTPVTAGLHFENH